MSQAFTTMVMTTTPMTVVSSSTSSFLSTVTMPVMPWFSTGRFLFQSWAPIILFWYIWCLFWCMLFAFRCHAGHHIHLRVLNHWGLHHCNPLELTHSRHMCNLVVSISPHLVCTEWLFPPLLWVGGSLLLLNQMSTSHSNYTVGHTALGAWQRVTQSLHLPCMVEMGLLFQVWFHPMTQSTLNHQWALNQVWWLGIRLMS